MTNGSHTSYVWSRSCDAAMMLNGSHTSDVCVCVCVCLRPGDDAIMLSWSDDYKRIVCVVCVVRSWSVGMNLSTYVCQHFRKVVGAKLRDTMGVFSMTKCVHKINKNSINVRSILLSVRSTVLQAV